MASNKTRNPNKSHQSLMASEVRCLFPEFLHHSQVNNLKINNMAQNIKDAVYKRQKGKKSGHQRFKQHKKVNLKSTVQYQTSSRSDVLENT